MPGADRPAHLDPLVLVEPLRLSRQIRDERDQQDGAERIGIVGRELEDTGVGLEARPHDVALDGDGLAIVAAGRLPRDDRRAHAMMLAATRAAAQTTTPQPGVRDRIAGLP